MDHKVESAERCRRCLDVEEVEKMKWNTANRETWDRVEQYNWIKDGSRRQWVYIFKANTCYVYAWV